MMTAMRYPKRPNHEVTLYLWVFLVVGAASLVVLLAGGCENRGSAQRTLEAQGFTDARFTGWTPFVCGSGDWSATGFVAKNPKGVEVEGTVCCGLLTKGCTVRF